MQSLPIELTRELGRTYHSVRHLYEFSFTSKTYRWTDANVDVYEEAIVCENNYWWKAKGIEYGNIQLEALPSIEQVTFTINNADHEVSDRILAEECRGKRVRVYAVALDLHMNVLGGVLIFYGYTDRVRILPNKLEIECYNHLIKWKTLTPRRLHTSECFWVFQDDDTCTYNPAAQATTTVAGAWGAVATFDVAATAGMSDTTDTKIRVTLDDGSYHWSKITSVVDANTLIIDDAFTAGTVGGGNAVQTYAWCDHSWERCVELSNSANFGGFRWCAFLQDKNVKWGRD